MLQLSFAATAATIDSGAVAERMNFKPYVILSTLISGALLRPHRRPAPPAPAAADRRGPPAGFFYPLACHWCWDPNGCPPPPPFLVLTGQVSSLPSY